MARRTRTPKSVENITHEEAKRRNLPSAEQQALVPDVQRSPVQVAYERRNRDLDPQLVWRGKDEQDLSDLVVNAPPLYIQERVHPKVLVDDLMRETKLARDAEAEATQPGFTDLFADFNGLPTEEAKTEFYQHDANWSNRMVLGDSLQVMASLAEREGLRGKVQCIYIDPPYGIRFNSNFQWSTTSRDVRDGNAAHITREPEQVKAFRDTWRDGIHSYLTYLRDRLTVARDLLTESGSIFVQIGDENVHRVRALMDEVFGETNSLSQITFRTSSGRLGSGLDGVSDYLLWYAKDISVYKYRPLLTERNRDQLARAFNYAQRADGTHFPLTKQQLNVWLDGGVGFDVFQPSQTQSQSGGASSRFIVRFDGKDYMPPSKGGWRSTPEGFDRLGRAMRLYDRGRTVRFRLKHSDYPFVSSSNVWMDTLSTTFGGGKNYVVETNTLVIQRCILMTTDPGDLVLDPTCGSGTTAYVAEQWGRRWITIDTSRVALALARTRVMGARYPYYLLSDSEAGQRKEAELTGREPSIQPTFGDVRQGFVYERVPHITLRDIANNSEIDVIWEEFQETLEPLRHDLNAALDRDYAEWEIPREPSDPWPEPAAEAWLVVRSPNSTEADKAAALQILNTELERNYSPDDVPDRPRDPWEPVSTDLHRRWWELRIERQRRVDESIARNAQFEYLYDRPYEDRNRVRVAGPFTVESISPHRMLEVGENDEVIDRIADSKNGYGTGYDFAQIILDALRVSGVQQAHREDRIVFDSLAPWPGRLVCAEGRYSGGQGPAASDQTEISGRSSVPSVQSAASTANSPLVEQSLPRTRSGGWGEGEDPATTQRTPSPLTGERLDQGHDPATTQRTPSPLTGEGWGEGENVDSGPIPPDAPRQVRAAIFIGPEFGTVTRPDLVEAAREAAEAEFDVLIACAFNYEAHTTEFESLGRVRVLKARMNADLHMATDLKNTGSGNLFVIFGEPDIDILDAGDNQVQVRVNGVDVFHPQTGEVRSDGPDGIACWFIDTDYNEEAFFVRHAYFLGANDPYRSLKTTLKAEIDADAWESLHSDISRPFPKPESGRIAVKVINNLGDEVMKVFRVR